MKRRAREIKVRCTPAPTAMPADQYSIVLAIVVAEFNKQKEAK